MPENALIDDEPPPPPPAKKDNIVQKNVQEGAGGDPKKAAPVKKPVEPSKVRRMSIPGLLATNNKNNDKKERRSLLGKLSDDLEYLEGLLQVNILH